jgi:hypothetical protein
MSFWWNLYCVTVLFPSSITIFWCPTVNFKLGKYAVKRKWRNVWSSSITAFHIFFRDHITWFIKLQLNRHSYYKFFTKWDSILILNTKGHYTIITHWAAFGNCRNLSNYICVDMIGCILKFTIICPSFLLVEQKQGFWKHGVMSDAYYDSTKCNLDTKPFLIQWLQKYNMVCIVCRYGSNDNENTAVTV